MNDIVLLVGRCYLETEQYEECVKKMSPGIIGDGKKMEAISAKAKSFKAKYSLILGKAYEALDNRERAIECYKITLENDVFCSEAFEILVDHHLLSASEEVNLLEQLNFTPESVWLRDLYSAKILHQSNQLEINERFKAVEEKYGMKENSDVAVAKANCFLRQNDPVQALEITSMVRRRDPFHMKCVVVHITALVGLSRKSELFLIAHNLVDAYPSRAVSWFAVGCYYYTVKKFDAARRYFNKATTVEPQFAPAWIGFGIAFTAQDESDQAMAAYRTASRLFPGSHVPLLCTGMEYIRTNNLKLAEQLLLQSSKMCPSDPSVLNEIGVVNYKQGYYEEAITFFTRALELSKHEPATFYSNLAHAYRKIGKYDEAIRYYLQSIALEPKQGDIYAALGLTYHLKGSFIKAIELYHQSLGLRPGNTFASTLLDKALTHASFEVI